MKRTRLADAWLPTLFALACFLWVPAVLVDNKLSDFAISDADVRSSGSLCLGWFMALYGAHSPFVANWVVTLGAVGYLALPIVSFIQKRFRIGTYLSIVLAAAIFGLYGNFLVYSHTELMDKYSISLVTVAVTAASAFVPVGVYAAVRAMRGGS